MPQILGLRHSHPLLFGTGVGRLSRISGGDFAGTDRARADPVDALLDIQVGAERREPELGRT